MQQAYLTVTILTHLAFAGVFLFLHAARPSKFLKYVALAWLVEAFRALMLGMTDQGAQLTASWVFVLDALYLFVTWWLFSACADSVGFRLSKLWPTLYFGLSLPALVSIEFFVPSMATSVGWTGRPVVFYTVLLKMILLFLPGVAARFTGMAWFFRHWKQTRMPGALVVALFFFPHAIGSLAVPFQWYFSFFPPSMHLFWFFHVLGLSIGFVILVLNQQAKILRTTEEHYRLLFENSPLPIWAYDRDTLGFLMVNEACIQHYGYSREEFLKMKIMDVCPPEEVLKLLSEIAQGLPAVHRTGVRHHRKKEGTLMDVEIVGYSVDGDENSPRIVVAQDVTERMHAESEREKLIVQLQEALTNVKTLRGLLPICASCKSIRDDQGYWNRIETYISSRSQAEFSHGLCPECERKLYPEFFS